MKIKEPTKDYIVEKNLEEFIEKNYNEFKNLDPDGEILEVNIDKFNTPEINYLKENYRFDYKGICVYYEEEDNKIYVENMLN
jgi:hypothetical protein